MPFAFCVQLFARLLGVMKTLYRAPRANAVRERSLENVRRECLDHFLL